MPNLVNVGAINVNTINKNSTISSGHNSSGDVIINKKSNKVFGAIFGNANLFIGNYGLVFDPDAVDHFGLHTTLSPSLSNTFE